MQDAIPVVLSWSSGKDSAWALHVLRRDPRYRVVALLTTITIQYERISIHGLRREILHAQARATGLPVIEARIPPHADNAAYEAAFAQALDAAVSGPAHRPNGPTPGTALQDARKPVEDARHAEATCAAASDAATPAVPLGHIAFGDLFLADVRAYREALCARRGWTPIFPLFGADTAALAREMIAGGLRARLCCVDTTQLDAGFAGRPFDLALLADLPPTVDPCGERGEFHTCVTAGPMFDRALCTRTGDRVLRDDRFQYIDLALA